ncbi:radical SAM protein [bacterium]|nr:radical SAM protein [bacterium]MBU1065882.1 radical SAM protein [bacterium]MBU1635072.1 radical SAM protein [bacterium]MBU1874481.1 radical SAM protein [bacterium]
MKITEVTAKSILRQHRRIDSWFLSRYGMNLFRGCTHNCSYCDGRAENYYVDGDFGIDVAVKINAVEVLSRELDPGRKRKPMKSGFIMLGGGVGDAYQPIENKYEITRQVLELIQHFKHPVHILTKSVLVKRDIDKIKAINSNNRAIISFSFSSVSDELSAKFEPGCSSPSERLEAIRFFKNEGIACGMYLMPVIPFISDTREMIEDAVKKGTDAGVDFIIFGGMTLKEGRQKDYYMNIIQQQYPELSGSYDQIYRSDKWGQASGEYHTAIHAVFKIIADHYNIPVRMPLNLFQDIVDENDRVVVILDHIDYYLKMSGNRSSYGYAAYVISQINEPISSMKWNLRHLKGIGPTIAKVIREILDTGTSSLYNQLIRTHYANHY